MSTIVLWNTFLTNEDLNVIFKSWMEMKSYQNLEYLEMNLRNLEDCVEVAMKDIPYEIRHSIPTPDPAYTLVGGIFDVTRKDGQPALIGVYEDPTGFFLSMCPRLPLLNPE
ncbi:hypothetical protein L3Y34_017045 [Caenorhabditis briggsae]|uniref:Sdz-33 F-box domain-containing protein n=1 Tax=Caenorhabditis briggsae TaxID=6238 RepID=A0AAE9ISG6_CAEBR|nr:hypothetical protein L3Y34_017045 [Caenorhabditis briggsae]